MKKTSSKRTRHVARRPAGAQGDGLNKSGETARAEKIYRALEVEYPHARPALDFGTPFELLIATILSAQCTDARVNMVTPGLFGKYTSAKDFALANQEELQEAIRSTGFYRQKAKSIIGCCTAIVETFDGEVPRRMEDLLTLPGVGRKTANVLLGNAFGIPGIAVDTHVGRLAARLGFTNEEDPTEIEFDLMNVFPKKNWTHLCHLLMAHGRKICGARLPKCDSCVVSGSCPSAFKFSAKSGFQNKKGK